MRKSNSELLKTAIISPQWMDAANAFKKHYEKNHDQYAEAWAHTNVPAPIIAVVNYLENGGRFDRHPHNGDALSARTHQVPAGRPKEGNPPFTWLESAIDCFKTLKKMNEFPWGEDYGKDLDKLESFNGLGYKNKNMVSPYIWSGCQHYLRGKYVADGKFDPNAVSKQLGAWALLMIVGYFKQ